MPPRTTPRARTTSHRWTYRELEHLRLLNEGLDYERPRTRGECVDGPRPCPFVCRYSLLWEVSANGGIKELHPEEDYAGPSCALDVADAGEHTLGEVGRAMNVTKERARQIQERAVAKLSGAGCLGETGEHDQVECNERLLVEGPAGQVHRRPRRSAGPRE